LVSREERKGQEGGKYLGLAQREGKSKRERDLRGAGLRRRLGQMKWTEKTSLSGPWLWLGTKKGKKVETRGGTEDAPPFSAKFAEREKKGEHVGWSYGFKKLGRFFFFFSQ